ncbi:uncharacterized protein [Ptychodera flava]|uniref:uncharacterized protein n=1 Tax=Ptychodera flava TaxID=63121 RepID=UPI003969D76B
MASNMTVPHVIEDIDDIIKRWVLEDRPRDKYEVDIVRNGLKFTQVGDIEYTRIQDSSAQAREMTHATTFVNDTSSEQKHRLTTERSLRTSYTWSLTSGHTFGAQGGISLKPPASCVEAGIEFNRQSFDEKRDEKVFEKSRKSTLDSEITVKPKKKVSVYLKTWEEDYAATYKIKYRVKGGVKAVIRDKHGTNVEGEAPEIFCNMEGFRIDNMSKGTVLFENKGLFLCKRELSQEFEVKEEDL